ncbi:hypothetical protein SERLADRAFT_412573 [Serpula lacrymans var. lacrymans S7.9]|uniref:Uncharacterized protein n=1 Tax=Serpula lacrymans var. lacrymans (strain S7.9) TaxID=578457 RepID=F8NEX9_SERL9|nr:uncharacterized protein SERLADRAFT_412573 [Serpula lacrymans var. lacrymans S7.9]EGO31127.1 hypothetical protein SERLADRAFT_412573 [Serpula lacrymans var. lacrymans S7.9]
MPSYTGKRRRRSSTPCIEETSSSENSSKSSTYNNAAPTVLAHAAEGPSKLEQHWLKIHGDTYSVKQKENNAGLVAATSPLVSPRTPTPPPPTKDSPVLRLGSTSTHTSDGVISYHDGGGFGQGCPVDRKGRYKYNRLERYQQSTPSFSTPTKSRVDDTASADKLPTPGVNLVNSFNAANKENSVVNVAETTGKSDGKGTVPLKRRIGDQDTIDNEMVNIIPPLTPGTGRGARQFLVSQMELSPLNPGKRRRVARSEAPDSRVSQDLEETLRNIKKNLDEVGKVLKEDVGGAIREQTEVLKGVLHEFVSK